jgi:hypothetical protein
VCPLSSNQQGIFTTKYTDHTRYVLPFAAAGSRWSNLGSFVSGFRVVAIYQSMGCTNIYSKNQNVGIIADLSDNLQYASLAMENSLGGLGHYLMSNLYTTEPHLGILVNLYFLVIGILSKWLSVHPIVIMTIISFLAPPIVGYMVFIISSRILALSTRTSVFATALVILGSGPSLVLRCINAALSKMGMSYTMPLGQDYSFHDLFPINSFLFLPFQSIATALLVTVLTAIMKTLRTDLTTNPSRWVIVSAGGLAVFALVRPYEAFSLTALFLVAMLVSRLIRGKGLLFRYHDYLIIGLLVAPSLFYIVWLSFLPGWRDWARTQFLLQETRTSFVIGLSVFWFIAITGVVRAATERRLDMLLLCLWTLSTILLLIGFGGAVSKLCGGAVIAYGILGAFGLEKILCYLAAHSIRYQGIGWKMFRALAASTAGVLIFGTSLLNYYSMAGHQAIPYVDGEILTAASLIRQNNPDSIPIVLAECSAGEALPAFAGARVYSGHEAMTPDFKAKCRELELAGLGEQFISNPGFDQSRLKDIVARTKPDFILVRRGTLAEQWLLDQHAAWAKMTGQRWSLLVTEK